MNKTYLGDSVYAELDDDTGDVVLTTDNGEGASNKIILDPLVMAAFQEWYERICRQ